MMSNDAMMIAAFRDELEQIAKEGGLKDMLLKEIPGTKPWLIGNAQVASRMGKPATSAAAKAVTKPKLRSGQSGGAWDVSRQAAAMGL